MSDGSQAMREILRVGTSAGGARAKALDRIRTRHPARCAPARSHVGAGFEYWILKFDGVDDGSRDPGAAAGYGAIEYAYAQMARAAGIEMSDAACSRRAGGATS